MTVYSLRLLKHLVVKRDTAGEACEEAQLRGSVLAATSSLRLSSWIAMPPSPPPG